MFSKFLFNIIFFTSVIFLAAPFDTGYIKWYQPDGTKFTARKWGDEFFNWFETEEGYAITLDADNWYKYSKLDNTGEYTASNKIVDKHKPTGFVKHLKRSIEKINTILAEQDEVAEYRLQKYNNYKGKGGFGNLPKSNGNNTITTTQSVKLGVFLVDFQNSQREDYDKYFYDDMLFSVNTYIGSGKRPPGDGDLVFGSLNDYIIDQTNNAHNVVGKNGQPVIVNDASGAKADWMVLAHNRSYYNNLAYQGLFINTIIQEIEAEYGTTLMKSFDVIGLIFAGDSTNGYFGAAARLAQLSDGTDVGTFRVPEHDGDDFVHIGLIAHEFCHSAFGLQDEYKGTINPGTHCLMANGFNNGPSGAGGACPAPINLGYKVDLGWVTPTIISKGSPNYIIDDFDEIYKVEIYGESDQYFLLNIYEDEGFYEYTPSQTQAQEHGLSIWHWNKTYMHYDWAEVERSTELSIQKFPSDKSGVQSFNDYTTVDSKKRDGTLSDVAINDIDINITFHPYSFKVIIDVIDPAPQPPTITMSGSWGDSPTLSWTNNTEPDFDHYILKKEYDFGSGWGSPYYINPATSPYTDNNVEITKFGDLTARYSVCAVDAASNTSAYSNLVSTLGQSLWKSEENEVSNLTEYRLYSNYPNPFNPTTNITFQIPQKGHLIIKIYDVLGNEVSELINEEYEAGLYTTKFDATNLPSGIYFYNLIINGFSQSKKMILTK